MKNAVLAFSLFFAGCSMLAAQAVSGYVTDSLTGKPVAYAAIQYAPDAGVITNEEGYFQLGNKDRSPGTLTISCLGYESKTVSVEALGQAGNTIRLKESVVHLNEVFLSNRVPDADEIMARVRAGIAGNYQSRLKTHRLFSRATEYVDFEGLEFEVARASGVSREGLEKTNRELDSLARAIVQNRSLDFRDFSGDLYHKDESAGKLQVDKATFLNDSRNDFSVERIQKKAQGIILQYLDTAQTYKLKTGIIKIEDSLKLGREALEEEQPNEYKVASLRSQAQDLLKTALFYEDAFLTEFLEPRAYDFSFQKATFLNDELIYVLNFRPGKSRSRYEGKVFVNGNDFAIVKINYRFAEGKRGDKVNLKLLLGIKYIEDTENGTILFNKTSSGTYEPTYIQRTSGSYFYISRPVKFIENSSEKDKVRFDFTIAGNTREKQELLITNSESLEEAEFNAFEEGEKIPVTRLKKYDETLWQGEEILQPLEEMRQFNAIQ